MRVPSCGGTATVLWFRFTLPDEVIYINTYIEILGSGKGKGKSYLYSILLAF